MKTTWPPPPPPIPRGVECFNLNFKMGTRLFKYLQEHDLIELAICFDHNGELKLAIDLKEPKDRDAR